MSAISKAIGATAPLAVVLAIVASGSRAESRNESPGPKDVLRALAEAGKPGPEHKKLQTLIGDWDFTLRMWTDPNQRPAELRGTVARKWIMGGRFVQETAEGEFEGKPFEGMGLWGYDRSQKKYTNVRACSLCGTIFSGLSESNASGTRFECPTEGCCPVTGETIKGYDEILIVSEDKIVMNVFKTIDGKDVKTMEIVSTRR